MVMMVIMVMLVVTVTMVMMAAMTANHDSQDLGWCISSHEGLGWGSSWETLLALSFWRCSDREFWGTGLLMNTESTQ